MNLKRIEEATIKGLKTKVINEAYDDKEIKTNIQNSLKAVLQRGGYKGAVSVRVVNGNRFNATVKSADLLGDIKNLVEYNSQNGSIVVSKVASKKLKEIERSNSFEGGLNQSKHDCFKVSPDMDSKLKKISAVTDELWVAMKSGDFYDKSDVQSDYFDVAYYFDLTIKG